MPVSMLPEYPEALRRDLARIMLRQTLRVKRGENLIVDTWSGTLPWAESVILESRILGARPILLVEDEPTYWKSMDEAPTANVGLVGSHEWAALKEADAVVYFYGPMDTEREAARPPSLQHRLNAIDHEWFRLIEKYGVRAVRFDLGRTNEVWARRYGVDLESWRKELIAGSTVDPRTLQQDGARIADAFRRGKELTISHPNGTDLVFRLVRRKATIDDGVIDEEDVRTGRVWTTLPSGVTTVAVDETYAEGTFIADTPGVMFLQGRDSPLSAGTWTFHRGRLAKYSFKSDSEEFLRQFPKLGPGKDRPGLVSVGLNPRTTMIPLLFDQERGKVTIAIGHNTHAGGATRTPHFSAYQSLGGATLEVDGKSVVVGGQLA
jgi:leucyl aminopeptidase (aminopeptidase T)